MRKTLDRETSWKPRKIPRTLWIFNACRPFCRGTYNRVARGERASKAISEALRAEI